MKTHYRICLIILISWIYCSSVNAQLVNIESRRMQTDSIRFALKSDFLFKYASNNGNEIYHFGSNLTTQMKSKDLRKIWFFVGSYSLIRSSNQDFANNWMAHTRYNHQLSEVWRFEAFVQTQENRLLVIDSRSLAGSGIRLKFISTPNTRAYFGNSYMYEIEGSSRAETTNYNHRHSSYLSFSYNCPDNRYKLTNTVYFQPLYEEFSNHRVLEQFKLEIPLNKHISFSGLLNYFYMSQTPLGGADESASARFGVTLTI